MKEKRLLIVLFAALLAFSLFGCGKKEDAPAAYLDTSETGDTSVDTTGTTGVKGDTTGTSADKLTSLEQQEKTTKTELQGDALFALFKKCYDKAKELQKIDNEYGTDFYKKYSDQSVSYAQQRDIGTLEDANVYYFISKAVHGLDADGFASDPDYFNNYVLPSDGFEQYVAWREAQTSTSSSSQNGNTGSSGSQSNQGQQGGTPSSGNTNSGSNNGTGNTGSGTGSSSGNNTSGGPSDGEGVDVSGDHLTQEWIDECINRPPGGTVPTGPYPDWARMH